MGPTASGKTAAILNFAKKIPLQVINADSRQLYEDFPIITAQPNKEERAQCPHELYGYLPTQEKSAAGTWARLANKHIKSTLEKSHIPALVGGTGLYFKALFDGMTDIPSIDIEFHKNILKRCEELGSDVLHEQLQKIDPDYAARIHPHDKQRIMRAIEVYESTGKTFTYWHTQTPEPDDYEVLYIGIGIDLKELTPIIQKRTQLMLDAGAIEEAERALIKCPDITSPGWTGIGCREIASYLQGNISKTECIHYWDKSTRAYAKRQWTWFRADKRIQWFLPNEREAYTRTVMEFLEK